MMATTTASLAAFITFSFDLICWNSSTTIGQNCFRHRTQNFFGALERHHGAIMSPNESRGLPLGVQLAKLIHDEAEHMGVAS
jgi:hypothetical protein